MTEKGITTETRQSPDLRPPQRERLNLLRAVMHDLTNTDWDLSADDLVTITEYVRCGPRSSTPKPSNGDS